MTEFISGQWNAICDRCGCKYKSGKMRKEWTGKMVCRGADTNDCWEPRHPQDLVRGRADNQSTPWNRSEPEDTFIVPGPINTDVL